MTFTGNYQALSTSAGQHTSNLIKLTLNSESSKLSGITYLLTQDNSEDDKADGILKYCATYLLFLRLQKLSCYHINTLVNTFTLFMNIILMLLHLSLYSKYNPSSVTYLESFGRYRYTGTLPCPQVHLHVLKFAKDSLIGTLKERSKLSKGASRFSEWQYEVFNSKYASYMIFDASKA